MNIPGMDLTSLLNSRAINTDRETNFVQQSITCGRPKAHIQHRLTG